MAYYTLALECCHFDLAPVESYDGLAPHYFSHPVGLTSSCDGCGASFTLQHGLDYKKRGLVVQRYNEIRKCLGDLASEV